MNTPYVKKYDENGKLLNPIDGRYESKTYLGTKKVVDPITKVTRFVPQYAPNRRERRAIEKDMKKQNKKPRANVA